jgi:predicted deacylase
MRNCFSPPRYVSRISAPRTPVLQPGQGGDRTLGGRGTRLSMGTELGAAGTVTGMALRIAKRHLHNLLVHLGILPPEERIEPPERTRIFDVGGRTVLSTRRRQASSSRW